MSTGSSSVTGKSRFSCQHGLERSGTVLTASSEATPGERSEPDSTSTRPPGRRSSWVLKQRRSELASTSFLTVVTGSMGATKEARSRHRRQERSDTVEHFFRLIGDDCGVASGTTSRKPARLRESILTGRQTGFLIVSGTGARGASGHSAPPPQDRYPHRLDLASTPLRARLRFRPGGVVV